MKTTTDRSFRIATLLPSLAAGVVAGTLMVILAVSFASLIYSGPLKAFLSTGIGIALYSALALGLVTTLTTSLPGVIGSPQSVPAIIVGLNAAAIAGATQAFGSPQALLSTVLVANAATTLLAGVFFLLLGTFRVGRLVRFIPYPVVGGFLAGTGLLLVRGGFDVMAGITLSMQTLPELAAADAMRLWLPGILFAFTIVLARRINGHFLTMPAIILLGTAAFHLWLYASGTSLSAAGNAGWLLGPFPEAEVRIPLGPSAFASVNWSAIAEQIGGIVLALVVSVLALLLNATGVELATGRSLDLDRELRSAGLANLVSGAGGGLAGYQSLGLSILAHEFGGPSRITGIVSTLVCGTVLFFGFELLIYFPRPIIGGIIVFLGLGLLMEWLVDGWSSLSRLDYATVAMIVLVMANLGFLEGVAVGLAMAVVILTVDLSRISAVKHALTATEHPSTVERPRAERQFLDRMGDRIHILELQGFIFFGTTNVLAENVTARMTAVQKPLSHVILDFRRVTGLDSSAVLSLRRLEQLSASRGVDLVLTHLSEGLRAHLVRQGLSVEGGNAIVCLPDLDRGVEWCEERILEVENFPELGVESSLRHRMLEMMVSELAVDRLMSYLRREEYPAGHVVTREGDDPDSMYFLEWGQVSVNLEMPGNRMVRLRTMNPGTTIGEVGLYLGTPRTATVITEKPCTLSRLTRDGLERLEREEPGVAALLHKAMVRIESERLASLNTMVRALTR